MNNPLWRKEKVSPWPFGFKTITVSLHRTPFLYYCCFRSLPFLWCWLCQTADEIRYLVEDVKKRGNIGCNKFTDKNRMQELSVDVIITLSFFPLAILLRNKRCHSLKMQWMGKTHRLRMSLLHIASDITDGCFSRVDPYSFWIPESTFYHMHSILPPLCRSCPSMITTWSPLPFTLHSLRFFEVSLEGSAASLPVGRTRTMLVKISAQLFSLLPICRALTVSLWSTQRALVLGFALLCVISPKNSECFSWIRLSLLFCSWRSWGCFKFVNMRKRYFDITVWSL